MGLAVVEVGLDGTTNLVGVLPDIGGETVGTDGGVVNLSHEKSGMRQSKWEINGIDGQSS